MHITGVVLHWIGYAQVLISKGMSAKGLCVYVLQVWCGMLLFQLCVYTWENTGTCTTVLSPMIAHSHHIASTTDKAWFIIHCIQGQCITGVVLCQHQDMMQGQSKPILVPYATCKTGIPRAGPNVFYQAGPLSQ